MASGVPELALGDGETSEGDGGGGESADAARVRGSGGLPERAHVPVYHGAGSLRRALVPPLARAQRAH
jgi:hypothetical protein